MKFSNLNLLSLQAQAILELPDLGNISVDEFFSSLNLDAICSVDPLLKLELEQSLVLEEAKLQKAKAMVSFIKNQLVGLISNQIEVVEAIFLIINSSSILDDQKSALASLRD